MYGLFVGIGQCLAEIQLFEYLIFESAKIIKILRKSPLKLSKWSRLLVYPRCLGIPKSYVNPEHCSHGVKWSKMMDEFLKHIQGGDR